MTDAVLDEILEELEHVDPDCTKCGKPMISVKHFRAASESERQELAGEGYDVAWSDTVCRTCHREDIRHTYARRTPEQRAERRDRTWKAYVALRDSGMTDIAEIAKEIGITKEGLHNAVRRAKRRGDIPS